MENKIKLVQLPKITHQLQKAGKEVDERIAELNLDNLVATIETVKSLKDIRASLNTEHREFKEQLKEALEPAINPITEVKELFKVNISEKYTPADALLKDKIAIVEDKVKDEKKEVIKAYFNELCASEEIDFLKFENLELDIKLSVTEKKYKETVNEYVLKVVDDVNLIKTQDFEVEIMVEYKKTLNVSASIKTVKDRKENERVEAEQVKQREYLRRSRSLQDIGLLADKETQTYVYNEETYVVWDKVKDLDKKEFENVVIQFDTKIKSLKLDEENRLKELVKQPEPKQSEQVEKPKEVIQVTKPIEVKEPLLAPKEEAEEELEKFTASFEVTGTYAEIMKVKAFLKENNFNYKNI